MRKDCEKYYTPAEIVSCLSYSLDLPEFDSVLEPFVGKGDLVRGIKSLYGDGIKIITNDLYPDEFFNPTTKLDASLKSYWESIAVVDAVITNPPFSLANNIVPMIVESDRVKKFIAILLRISFLEPTLSRGSWLSKNPPDYLISLPRISFDGKGTDTVNTCWFIWDKTKEVKNSGIIVVPKESKRKKHVDVK